MRHEHKTQTQHIEVGMKKTFHRREMIKFLGTAALGAPLFLATGCKVMQKPMADNTPVALPEHLTPFIEALLPNSEDKVKLSAGLKHQVMLRWQDEISDKDTFGSHCDFLCFIPMEKGVKDDGLLWVNHEYMDPRFCSGFNGEDHTQKTKEQVDKEMYDVGGSIVRMKKGRDGKWRLAYNDAHNRRLNGHSRIPFAWPHKIAGSDHAIGTFGNCSGGITPWGTILTAEENYQAYYGESVYDEQGNATREPGYLAWQEKYPDHMPEHYGWVVEVDLFTGEARKLVALGRCCHECATVHRNPDGTVVVYSGDDGSDRCLYKFISSEPNSLEKGTLYVADTINGKWISLDWNEQPILQEKFKDQTEVLVRLREAAPLVGGTPLNRPEDIEIDPISGNVFVSLTNNKLKEDYHGSILKISEHSEDKTSLTFSSETYLAGGEEFSCPDNMAFDNMGNLWFTSDISGSAFQHEIYAKFKSNGLFVVPRSGDQAGKVIQVGSAPVAAEFTGPWFSPDSRTLFLSVQHPGETSPTTETKDLTSNWPDGDGAVPKSAVIAITGELLDTISGLA